MPIKAFFLVVSVCAMVLCQVSSAPSDSYECYNCDNCSSETVALNNGVCSSTFGCLMYMTEAEGSYNAGEVEIIMRKCASSTFNCNSHAGISMTKCGFCLEDLCNDDAFEEYISSKVGEIAADTNQSVEAEEIVEDGSGSNESDDNDSDSNETSPNPETSTLPSVSTDDPNSTPTSSEKPSSSTEKSAGIKLGPNLAFLLLSAFIGIVRMN